MCHPRGMSMESTGRSGYDRGPSEHVVVVVVVVVVVSAPVSAP